MSRTVVEFLRSRALIFLSAFFCLVLMFGLLFRFTVVEINNPVRVIRVTEGDELVHSYTHSMYLAPVSEQFIIQNGKMKLMAVSTPNVAVLEYFGLNSEDTRDRNLVFDSFTIPVASVGNHSIRVRDLQVDLGTGVASAGKIEVRVTRVNLFSYLMCVLWG